MTEAEREASFRERLHSLGVGFDEAAPQRLRRYHELLCHWNTLMNLTGDTAFDTALDRLYLDSLAPLQVEGLFPAGSTLVDVGSGAGFPGLPLAIVRPDLQVLLLDSLQKRVGFLDAVIEALSLPNVRTLHARAEDAAQEPSLREGFDLAVARAVAPLPVLCELLLPFVKVGGKMLCYKGPSAKEEQDQGALAAKRLGGGPPVIVPVALPWQPQWQHCVVVSEKKEKTLRQFPRKAGLPARQPLGKNDRV